MYTTTLLDGIITNTKVVDVVGFYNFIVYNLFMWNHLLYQNIVWSCHILKFKFWIVQTKSDGEMTKTKVVYLVGFYNFVFDDFFIWNRLLSHNIIWSFHILKFKILIVETKPDREMAKTKVVNLDDF